MYLLHEAGSIILIIGVWCHAMHRGAIGKTSICSSGGPREGGGSVSQSLPMITTLRIGIGKVLYTTSKAQV
jgi:hypothetical protein